MKEETEQDSADSSVAAASPHEYIVMCGVCTGTGKPVSGKPCICGGAGTQDAELQGFREEVIRLQDELDKKIKWSVNLKRCLQELVDLKRHKDIFDKDKHYLEFQPKAWKTAKKMVDKF